MNQNSLPTRLVEYIKALLPDAHGHQIKATIDFVLAIISVRSCSQAALARSFDNFEAAKRRLTRWLHNPRLDPSALACACARMIVTQLPLSGPLRISFDWTIEDTQHLLVASLGVGRRAIPLFWKAFDESQLKDHRSAMERGFVQLLFAEVLCDPRIPSPRIFAFLRWPKKASLHPRGRPRKTPDQAPLFDAAVDGGERWSTMSRLFS